MRLLTPLLLLVIIQATFSKNNVKALTESLGQEVIEMAAPVKDLPSDLEEEPSVENDDEKVTSTTIQAATKNTKKTTTTSKIKVVDKNSISKETDDEEARIEKELAEIYKDSIDYKSDSSEADKQATTHRVSLQDKSLRQGVKVNFKFQPDTQNKAEIEKFRTSVDEISCQKRIKLTVTTPKPSGNTASRDDINFIISVIPLTLLMVFK